MTLIGPDKWYDLALDNAKVLVQNPQYAHYTDVETAVSESAWPGLTATTADAGTDATHITDTTDTPFLEATIATVIGYKVYSIIEGTYGNVLDFISTSEIHTTGGTVADWSSDTYKMPVAKTWVIPMDSYNLLTMHYRLTADTNTTYIMKVFGTLDSSAVVDVETNWVDLTNDIFGATTVEADGIAAGDTVVTEGLKVLDTPSPMLKYMIKIVAEGNLAAATASSATVFIRKSS